MAWIRWYDGTGGRVARVQWRDPATGKTRNRTLGVVSEDEAETARVDAERRFEARAPRPVPLASRHALDRFLAFLRLRKRRDLTVEFYRARLAPMFAAWDSTPMRLWHRGLLEDFVGKAGADWSARTVQAYVNAARHFIAWARAVGVVCPDFVAGFRGPPVSRPERRHYSPEQIRTLLAASTEPGRAPWLELAVALAALAGASMGDLYRLTWSEIDLETGWLRSKRSKTGQPWVVRLPRVLGDVLRRHRAVAGPVVRDLPKHDTCVSHALARLCRSVGLDPTGGLKRLRHSYGTMLGVGRDVDLATGRAALGHAPGSAATLVYLHATTEGAERAANVLDRKMTS